MRPHLSPLLGLTLAFTAACASAPPAKCPAPSAGLSFEEARELVAGFEARQLAQAGPHRLRDPKSLEDVLEILKSDDLTLFPAGVAFAMKQDGLDAKALAAQTELAWGDSQLAVGRILNDLAARLEIIARAAERTHDPIAPAVRDHLRSTRGVSEALARLASEHLAVGGRLARQVIDGAPKDYQGYRVAADYYRLVEDWDAFDRMVAKIEDLKEESNGLVFLRGVSALEREGDTAKALRYFRMALEKDPKFVRAQAQILRAQPTLTDAYAEYQKLRALSPHHQLVVWTGEALESAWLARDTY